ncbi:MAG: hypothetical protein P1U56_07085 [Saprospiraceae bacterium]|nr:hypothetical protein [Saprospiraceae bacterium]
MKKILFALSFLMMVGVAANAQKACTKKAGAKCCASKKTASTDAATTRVASAMTEADIAAESDENIASRVCDVSGAKSYYMKSVCEKSGAVAWDEVKFCDKSKKFTKVASASMEKDVETGEVKTMKAKKECKKGAKAGCCSKKKSNT